MKTIAILFRLSLVLLLSHVSIAGAADAPTLPGFTLTSDHTSATATAMTLAASESRNDLAQGSGASVYFNPWVQAAAVAHAGTVDAAASTNVNGGLGLAGASGSSRLMYQRTVTTDHSLQWVRAVFQIDATVHVVPVSLNGVSVAGISFWSTLYLGSDQTFAELRPGGSVSATPAGDTLTLVNGTPFQATISPDSPFAFLSARYEIEIPSTGFLIAWAAGGLNTEVVNALSADDITISLVSMTPVPEPPAFAYMLVTFPLLLMAVRQGALRHRRVRAV
jgi:hypothetical protein